jgi:hypothetical protein
LKGLGRRQTMSEFSRNTANEEESYPIFENAVWWTVAIGHETYEIKACDIDSVKAMVPESGETDEAAQAFITVSSEAKQEELNKRYKGRDVVRTIPFSALEFPVDFANMTEEQELALEAVFGE